MQFSTELLPKDAISEYFSKCNYLPEFINNGDAWMITSHLTAYAVYYDKSVNASTNYSNN